MVSKRARAWIGAGTAMVVLVGAALVVGEIVARGRLDARAAALADSLPGVSVGADGGLALAQLASGSVAVHLTAMDAALDALVQCRTDQDLSVRAIAGGVVINTERTLRGMQLPVEVLLVPHRDDSGWRLVADSVSAAGISLPADRALKVLSGRDGDGAKLAERLLDGIPLSPAGMTVQDVAFRDGALDLTVSVPIAREGDGGQRTDSGAARLRSCLAASDSTDQEG